MPLEFGDLVKREIVVSEWFNDIPNEERRMAEQKRVVVEYNAGMCGIGSFLNRNGGRNTAEETVRKRVVHSVHTLRY